MGFVTVYQGKSQSSMLRASTFRWYGLVAAGTTRVNHWYHKLIVRIQEIVTL